VTKGIDLAIAADARSAQSAITRGIIDPLEDVAELLEQMGDGSKDASRDLERGMRDAQRRTDDAKDEIRDLRDELNRAGRAGKNAGDDVRDGMRRAESGVKDLKEESRSTAREAAASFDGSAESIADAFQEVAANAFSGFGPAGAAAGIAAAAGLGTVLTALSEQQTALNELKEKFAEVYRAAAEEGRTYLDEAQIQAGVLDILFDPAKRAAALKEAQFIGADLITIARAEAGSREDIARAIELANEKAAELQSKSSAAAGSSSVWAAGAQQVASKYEKLNELLEANEQAAREAQESRTRGLENEREQIKRTADASQARYEALAQKYSKPIEATVRMKVDDSAVRNYKPQPKSLNVIARLGARTWE
jgi:hypothetical protein